MLYRFFRRSIVLINVIYMLAILAYLPVRWVFQDSFWPLNLVNTFALALFLPLPALLILALLVRSRQAALSLLPVVIVGILWFAPRFLPRASAATEADLRVMSNNVWHWNPTIERVIALAEAEQPDVILLQEVDPAAQEAILAALEDEYPYHTSLVDEIRIWRYQAVNLTLSRYPFVESEQINLDLPEMPSINRNVIEVDGERVALYNVHLTSPDGGRARGNIDNRSLRLFFAYDDRARNQQIDRLLEQFSREPYAYVVAGDFNMSDLSATYSRLTTQMHDSFGEVGYGFGATWPMVEALAWSKLIPPLLRMDYVWSGGDLRPVRAWLGAFSGSDHLPVLADFVFS